MAPHGDGVTNAVSPAVKVQAYTIYRWVRTMNGKECDTAKVDERMKLAHEHIAKVGTVLKTLKALIQETSALPGASDATSLLVWATKRLQVLSKSWARSAVNQLRVYIEKLGAYDTGTDLAGYMAKIDTYPKLILWTRIGSDVYQSRLLRTFFVHSLAMSPNGFK